MLSLSNSYSLDEIYEFDERVRKGLELGNDSLFTKEIEYVCELKFDGLSISLIYVDGIFSQAITRGDGLQGDDVSLNAKTIKSLPLKLVSKNIQKNLKLGEKYFLLIKLLKKLISNVKKMASQCLQILVTQHLEL